MRAKNKWQAAATRRCANKVWCGWFGQGIDHKAIARGKHYSGVSMYLKPGGLRELHWHAIAAEWGYVVKGNVRTTVISPSGEMNWHPNSDEGSFIFPAVLG
jgi:oxalate decarboxylase